MSIAKKVLSEQEKFAPDRVNFGDSVRPADVKLQNVAPRQPGVTDEQFPTEDLSAKSPKDEMMQAKLALQTPNEKGQLVGEGPFGKLKYSDEDARWLIEKQKQAERAEFQLWFARNFDRMDPASKKWAREHYPEFYAARQRLVGKQAQNLVKLANLKLNGVKSFDDLMTQYLAETGRLDIGAVKHILNPEQDEQAQNNAYNFKRGLLSPFRVFGQEASKQTSDRRKKEFNSFAKREYPEDQNKYGLADGPGPLQMPGDRTDQGIKEWWKMLQSANSI